MAKEKDLLEKLSEKLEVPQKDIQEVLQYLQAHVNPSSETLLEKTYPFTKEELAAMQDDTLVDAVWLVVQCRKNDSDDIRVGGPLYLGYTFLVEQTKKEAYKQFVLEQMEMHHQSISPLSGSIFFAKETQAMMKDLTNKTLITRTISKGCE